MKKLEFIPIVLISLYIFCSVAFSISNNELTNVTIQQIQTRSDIDLSLGYDKSLLEGTYVTFVARVTAPPRVSVANNDYRTLLRGTATWTCYAQDTSNNLFGGIVIYQTTRGPITGLDLLDTGTIIRVSGVVNEFGSTSSSNFKNCLTRILIDTSNNFISVLGHSPKRPDPKQVNISDFIQGDYPNGGTINYVTGEKYEGMYVEIKNVVASSGIANRQPFSIRDGSGNKMYVRDLSNWFSKSPTGDTLRPWFPPPIGSVINSIRGVIVNSNNEGSFGNQLPYVIVPIYPNDLDLRDSSPPLLNNPENYSLSNPLSINFKWKNTSFPATYKFQLSTDLTFNNIIYSDSTLIDTFKTISGLVKDTQYYWRVGAKDTVGITYYSDTWNFKTFAPLKLKVKVLMEGFYNSLYNQQSRNDTISVYLRDAVPPYALRDSSKNFIDSLTFSGLFTYPNLTTGTYFIVIKHFNTIETWSKSGGEIIVDDGIVHTYDFTLSNTQAYGNNLKLKGGKYCIYSGDVNQDGFITLFDVIPVYNNASSFISGNRIPSDLNGDLIVDLTDVTICYNNSSNFIRVRRP